MSLGNRMLLCSREFDLENRDHVSILPGPEKTRGTECLIDTKELIISPPCVLLCVQSPPRDSAMLLLYMRRTSIRDDNVSSATRLSSAFAQICFVSRLTLRTLHDTDIHRDRE